MPTGSRFSERFLQEAAFELMASSTIGRYVRVACRFASEDEMRRLEVLEDGELLRAIEDLWRVVLRSSQREMSEVELAVLLAYSAQRSSNDFDQLLGTIGLSDRAPAAAWIGALARHLYGKRPSNKSVRIIDLFNASVEIPGGTEVVGAPSANEFIVGHHRPATESMAGNRSIRLAAA
jgi:hypothetical protein